MDEGVGVESSQGSGGELKVLGPRGKQLSKFKCLETLNSKRI